MDKKEAKELLSFHSSRNSDIHNPKWSNGFLGSLRPFRGELCEENFIEVMECLKTLKDEFEDAVVDKEIVGDIVAIVHLTREWAAPDGMLGRNGILTKEQTKCLFTWVDMMENCLMYLLDDDEEDAFSDYEDYREQCAFHG
ncbi:MAG: hypothetical protein K2N63_06510 [Lachnospiraceae bacterium]|nr:hypothetical protein [Lachnospiraceae bacterium]